jgi:hypothetical protein
MRDVNAARHRLVVIELGDEGLHHTGGINLYN